MQEHAPEAPIIHAYEAEVQGSASEGSAMDSDSYECAAAEQAEDIVNETLTPSLIKNRTRSKSKTVVLPESLMPSAFEDDMAQHTSAIISVQA